MFKVFFENSAGKSRLIGTAETKGNAFKVIRDFLKDHNFISYYTRTWEPCEKHTIVDVGSYTEFFHIYEIA